MQTPNNSINRAQHRKLYAIDSADRAGGNATDFNYTLQQLPERNQFNAATALSIELDKTYYLSDSSNNTFKVTTTASPTTATVTIPLGNYSQPNTNSIAIAPANSFGNIVQTALNAAGLDGTFSVIYDSFAAKYTIINTTSDFSINLTNDPSMARYLGLTADNTNASAGMSLTSKNVIYLQRYQILSLRTNLAINNNDNVLAYIFPNSFSSGAVVSYRTEDPISTSVGLKDHLSNYFHFSLLDEETNLNVDLQGGNFRIYLSLSREII